MWESDFHFDRGFYYNPNSTLAVCVQFIQVFIPDPGKAVKIYANKRAFAGSTKLEIKYDPTPKPSYTLSYPKKIKLKHSWPTYIDEDEIRFIQNELNIKNVFYIKVERIG